jgi:general stress protein YciG
MTPKEPGQKGGTATRDNHVMVCPLCGAPAKNGFFSDIGKRGGKTTLQNRGRSFYQQIGHLGGRGRKRNDAEKSSPKNLSKNSDENRGVKS